MEREKVLSKLNKFKGLRIESVVLLIIIFITIHMPVIKENILIVTDYSRNKFLEDKKIAPGDADCYLQNALSLFDFGIEEKFNDKYSLISLGPRIRSILATDMPWYAKYVLTFYPYPTFRFGYSLTAALLTVFFPQEIFQFHFPRLIFINILLMIFSLIIIFLILKKLTKNTAVAFIACLFFIFDVSNAFNSYQYRAHTMVAFFYFILSYYLFIRNKNITPFKLGLIYFFLLLSISIISSGYLVLLAILMGLSIYVSVCYKNKSRIFKYTLAAIIGCSILPLYIVGVEKLFGFQAIGLGKTVQPLMSWARGEFEIIKSIPIHLRFMWDLRLFDIFIVPQALIILFIIIYEKYRLKQFRNPLSNIRGLYDSFKECALKNTSYVVLFSAIIIITLATAFYATIPISRNMTPYTLLWGILLGAFLGKRFVKGGKIVKSLVGVIVLLQFMNFYLCLNIIKIPEYKPSCKILMINDDEAINKNAIAFQKTGRIDAYAYKMISKSIREFIETYDNSITDKDCIMFDAMYLVKPYLSSDWFVKKPIDVKKMAYLNDFRLIVEIFDLYKKHILTDKDIICRGKKIWDFSKWTDERYYVYGYSNYVKNYFKGTPLELINTHCIYYINYGALKRAYYKELRRNL